MTFQTTTSPHYLLGWETAQLPYSRMRRSAHSLNNKVLKRQFDALPFLLLCYLFEGLSPDSLRTQTNLPAWLGSQAFWWFVYNSILTSPYWLKCDWMGTGKGTFLLLAREKTNWKLSINPFFFIFAWKNITLFRCAPFKYESSAFG